MGIPKKSMMIQPMKASESVLSGYRSIFIFPDHGPCGNARHHCSSFCGSKSSQASQESHEKKPGWLGYIGDYTTQLYGDNNNHCKDPY